MEEIPEINTSEIKPKNEKDMRCAPTKKFEAGSCISLKILVEMAKLYNEKYNADIKISHKLEIFKPKKYKKYLIKEFSKKLDNICDNQRCWVKQDFMKLLDKKVREELQSNTFRPDGPAGKFTWLNTLDIHKVMQQYESKHKDFKFLGAVPIDFDELPELGIKDLNFKNNLFIHGIHKIGIIFNLDEHYKDGSHWVALYSDLKKGEVFFFDSYGIRPEKRIVALMKRIANTIKESGAHLRVEYNKKRHQYKNSECGVYSISFILRMLRGDTFEQITGTRISDDHINKCRQYYFA